jgi:hypothetical protein
LPFVAKLPASGPAIEPPGDFDAITIHPPIPGSRFPAQGLQIGDSSVTQTLPGEDPDFDLRLIEPTSVSRRVMDRESLPDFRSHFGAVDIGQRLPAMDVEVVHYQVNGLCFRVFQG